MPLNDFDSVLFIKFLFRILPPIPLSKSRCTTKHEALGSSKVRTLYQPLQGEQVQVAAEVCGRIRVAVLTLINGTRFALAHDEVDTALSVAGQPEKPRLLPLCE